jgi:hypothetical protein
MRRDGHRRSTDVRSSGRRSARVHERTIQTSRSGRCSTKLRRGGWRRVWERGCYAGSHTRQRDQLPAQYTTSPPPSYDAAPPAFHASRMPPHCFARSSLFWGGLRLVPVVSLPIVAVWQVYACDNRGPLSTLRTGPVVRIGDAYRRRATARQRASAPGLGLDHRPIPGRPVGPAPTSVGCRRCTPRAYQPVSVGPTASAEPGWAGML